MKVGIPISSNDKIRVNSNDTSAGFLADKLESSDSSVGIEVSSCGCTVDLSVLGVGGFVDTWLKASVSYTDFNVAASTIDFSPTEFGGLGAGLFVSGWKIKHSTAFVAGVDLNITASLRVNTSTITSSLNLASTVTDSNSKQSSVSASYGSNQTSTNDVFVRLVFGSETGDNLTAGEADIWIKVSYLL